MEEFEESGLLDEHDKVIYVTYLDHYLRMAVLNLITTVNLQVVFVKRGENTEVM
jgi:hypothetical protein